MLHSDKPGFGPVDGLESGIGPHLRDEVPEIPLLLPLAQAGVLFLREQHRDGFAAAGDVHGLTALRLVDEARWLGLGLSDRSFGHASRLLTMFVAISTHRCSVSLPTVGGMVHYRGHREHGDWRKIPVNPLRLSSVLR
jgi:hypothetical protein